MGLDGLQEKAAAHPYDRPAVVTAAAGSGKTTLLVERVARLLSDKENGLKAEKLAIMTFTRNAAKSLRERLNATLNKKLKEELPNEARDHLKEQIFGLRGAYISTIDAFCLRIIKENPTAFDLPMNFTIADNSKLAAMQIRAKELTWRDFYSEAPAAPFSEVERRALFCTFDFEEDDGLFEAVMSAADKLSTFSDADGWLEEAEKPYESVDALEKKYAEIYLPMIASKHSRARDLITQCSRLLIALDADVENIKGTKPDKAKEESFLTYVGDVLPVIKEYLNSDISRYEELRKDCETFESERTLKALCDIFSHFKAYGEPPKISTAGYKADARKEFYKYKKITETFRKNILKIKFDLAGTVASLPAQRMVIKAFIKLIVLYRGHLNSIMESSGCIGFSDCELRLLNKLKTDKNFCDMLSDRFSCIIVDEFQDSNDIQAEIFKLLGGGHLFYVGDIKQSIYAFRGGDPEIMARLCDGEDDFTVLHLNKNFRSRETVINVINAAFSGLMTREYGGVNYEDPENALEFGAQIYPPLLENVKEKYNCEICFVNDGGDDDDTDDKSDDEVGAMARAAAKKIQALHDDESFTIVKNGILTRPDYSDFAILLRRKKNIEKYRRALENLNIPSTSPAGKDLLESNEISLLRSYLTVIDNPLRDEETLKVLMSPIYRFTAEETALVRVGLLGVDKDALTDTQKKALAAYMKNQPLYLCALDCSKPISADDEKFKKIFKDELLEHDIERKPHEKLREFLRDMAEFSYYKGGCSVYRLICRICEETDLASFSAVLDNSTHCVANVRKFCDLAASFEERDIDGGNLSDFLRYIERVRSLKRSNVEDASRGADEPDAVQIMTFHGSKGLEAPVCVMAELEGKQSQRDYSAAAIMNRRYGLALPDVDIKNRVKKSTFAHQTMAYLNRHQNCGEELRLLYVAMTRAREKLIMLVKATSDKWKNTILDTDYPDELLETSTQPFKWIFASLMRKYDEETDTFKDLECTLSEISNKKEDEVKDEDTTNHDDGEEIDNDKTEYDKSDAGGETEHAQSLSEILTEKINFVYKHDADTRRREKYSVTELSHRNSFRSIDPKPPRFAAGAAFSGTDKGNAYHSCMQHIPLDKLQTADPSEYEEIIKSQINTMTEQRLLTEDEAKIIDAAHIAKFFSGELGQRMFKAKEIQREWPFYVEINGRDIDENDLGDFTLQGRIDLFFAEDDGIVVVDYKSDNNISLQKEKENYKQQVKIYSTVIPILTGIPVKETYLYAFLEDEAIK